MPKRKTIIEVQAEMPNVLVLKYESATAVTVKYGCGHVVSGVAAGSLREGSRCGQCHGSKRKTIIEVQAEFADLLVLKAENAFAVSVKGACNHVWTTQASILRKGHRCNRCHVSAPKSVLEYQAEFDDLLVLKAENARAVTVLGTCGHVWTAQGDGLRTGKRCAKCAKGGYKTDKAGFLYFMERPGEMQVGITGDPDERLATHARDGWQLIEMVGPHDGTTILNRENAIRKYLRENSLLIEGKQENWATAMWEPHSLAAIEHAARQLVAA